MSTPKVFTYLFVLLLLGNISKLFMNLLLVDLVYFSKSIWMALVKGQGIFDLSIKD